MTETEALHRRRRYLLEQIGKAADEINRIDERLAYLISPTFDVDLSNGGVRVLNNHEDCGQSFMLVNSSH
jgi:hypothetical protein